MRWATGRRTFERRLRTLGVKRRSREEPPPGVAVFECVFVVFLVIIDNSQDGQTTFQIQEKRIEERDAFEVLELVERKLVR